MQFIGEMDKNDENMFICHGLELDMNDEEGVEHAAYFIINLHQEKKGSIPEEQILSILEQFALSKKCVSYEMLAEFHRTKKEPDMKKFAEYAKLASDLGSDRCNYDLCIYYRRCEQNWNQVIHYGLKAIKHNLECYAIIANAYDYLNNFKMMSKYLDLGIKHGNNTSLYIKEKSFNKLETFYMWLYHFPYQNECTKKKLKEIEELIDKNIAKEHRENQKGIMYTYRNTGEIVLMLQDATQN